MKFWLVAVLVCFLAALAALGLKILLESPGQSEFQRYEPVDVPPEDRSPIHLRERLELETRGMSEEARDKYFFEKTPDTD